MSLLPYTSSSNRALDSKIFDGYWDCNIVHVNKNHTVEYITAGTSRVVQEVVETLDCVDVVDFNYTSRRRKFVPHNQNSLQFVRSDE